MARRLVMLLITAILPACGRIQEPGQAHSAPQAGPAAVSTDSATPRSAATHSDNSQTGVATEPTPAEHLMAMPPELLAPAPDAVLGNGTVDRQTKAVWDFDWSDVPGARDYNVYVIRVGSLNPSVEATIQESRYQHQGGYIANANSKGWLWMVRAQVGGRWSRWTPPRSFEVAPLQGDSRSPEPVTSLSDWAAQLVEHLKGADQDRASAATRTLAHLGSPAAFALVSALEHPTAGIAAENLLQEFGPDAAPAVPALIELLKKPDFSIRLKVLPVLGSIGPAAAEAVPELTNFVQDEPSSSDPGLAGLPPELVLMSRITAAQALWKITHDAGPLVPVLRDGLKSPSHDGLCRMAAAGVLADMTDVGAGAVDLVEPLVSLLSDHPSGSDVSVNAARALGNIGPAAKGAIPALERAAAATSPSLKSAAEASLRKIRGT